MQVAPLKNFGSEQLVQVFADPEQVVQGESQLLQVLPEVSPFVFYLILNYKLSPLDILYYNFNSSKELLVKKVIFLKPKSHNIFKE